MRRWVSSMQQSDYGPRARPAAGSILATLAVAVNAAMAESAEASTTQAMCRAGARPIALTPRGCQRLARAAVAGRLMLWCRAGNNEPSSRYHGRHAHPLRRSPVTAATTKAPAIQRLDHWTLVTSDVERTRRFYADVLGASVPER